MVLWAQSIATAGRVQNLLQRLAGFFMAAVCVKSERHRRIVDFRFKRVCISHASNNLQYLAYHHNIIMHTKYMH